MKHENYNVGKLNFIEFPDTGVEIVPAPAVANASYNYKYNGKELQEELGLNMYDYGARNYDPALGRFFSIDKYAEVYNYLTPYNYTSNNPIRFIDVNGEYIYVMDLGVSYRYENGKTYAKDDNGKWNEHKAEEGSYLGKVVGELNKMSSKDNGKSFLSNFNNNDLNVTFKNNEFKDERKNQNFFDSSDIIYTNFGNEDSDNPMYVILAHELGHSYSNFAFDTGSRNGDWFSFRTIENGQEFMNTINNDEIYGVYIENLIRKENNLAPRTHYFNEADYGPSVFEQSKIFKKEEFFKENDIRNSMIENTRNLLNKLMSSKK